MIYFIFKVVEVDSGWVFIEPELWKDKELMIRWDRIQVQEGESISFRFKGDEAQLFELKGKEG